MVFEPDPIVFGAPFWQNLAAVVLSHGIGRRAGGAVELPSLALYRTFDLQAVA